MMIQEKPGGLEKIENSTANGQVKSSTSLEDTVLW